MDWVLLQNHGTGRGAIWKDPRVPKSCILLQNHGAGMGTIWMDFRVWKSRVSFSRTTGTERADHRRSFGAGEDWLWTVPKGRSGHAFNGPIGAGRARFGRALGSGRVLFSCRTTGLERVRIERAFGLERIAFWKAPRDWKGQTIEGLSGPEEVGSDQNHGTGRGHTFGGPTGTGRDGIRTTFRGRKSGSPKEPTG